MPPSPAPLARPSCFIRGTDGGAVNWQKPVILMTINNSGGGEGGRQQPTLYFHTMLCPRYGAGDGEVDITEFDITESAITNFQESDITESDITEKGNGYNGI